MTSVRENMECFDS